MRILLALTVCIFLSYGAEAKIIKANTLAEAIEESNILNGKDSLYLSDFELPTFENGAKRYDITDQLVIINDLGDAALFLKEKAVFKVAITGALQLIGFDFSNLDSRLINLGKISLEDCTFTEGKDLTLYINNKGLFEIKNGVFKGSTEGTIIRDAYFKVGARVIL